MGKRASTFDIRRARADHAAQMAESVGADARLPCRPRGSARKPLPSIRRCHCGALLTVEATTHPKRTGDWIDVDIWESRSMTNDLPAYYGYPIPPGYHDDPAEWWKRLAENDIATYSALSAAYNLGYWWPYHRHIPKETIVPGTGSTAECHGWPMWAAPRGLVCRVVGTMFKYKEH